MLKTKDKIVQQAIQQFNQEGIASVSLKAIAKELNISDGNLRYHYKTKEDLVIAVLEAMKKDLFLMKQSFSSKEQLPNKDFFHHFFKGSYQIIFTYRCVYLDQVWLYHHMKNYTKIFSAYVNEWRQDFLETFKIMREIGVLSANYSDEQYKMLFEQLYIYSNSWILYYEQQTEKEIAYYVAICMSILAPYWNTTN